MVPLRQKDWLFLTLLQALAAGLWELGEVATFLARRLLSAKSNSPLKGPAGVAESPGSQRSSWRLDVLLAWGSDLGGRQQHLPH